MRRKNDKFCIAQNVVEIDDSKDGRIEETFASVTHDPNVLFGDVYSAKRRFQSGDSFDQEVVWSPWTSEADDGADLAKLCHFLLRV